MTAKCIVLALVAALVAADVSHLQSQGSSDKDAKILKQELDVGVEGAYQWAYETENGIAAQARGELKKVEDVDAQVVQGEARWASPEGESIQLQYVADENGYQPQGSHLPTSPPIPEAIIRALEYIKAHPPPPEKN